MHPSLPTGTEDTSSFQVLAAEQAQSAAGAAEHTARERLLKEQRRLSEALSICSALTQHLREVRGVGWGVGGREGGREGGVRRGLGSGCL